MDLKGQTSGIGGQAWALRPVEAWRVQGPSRERTDDKGGVTSHEEVSCGLGPTPGRPGSLRAQGAGSRFRSGLGCRAHGGPGGRAGVGHPRSSADTRRGEETSLGLTGVRVTRRRTKAAARTRAEPTSGPLTRPGRAPGARPRWGVRCTRDTGQGGRAPGSQRDWGRQERPGRRGGDPPAW